MNCTSKIELVPKLSPPSSITQNNSQPLESVQLRAAYSHVRVGTYSTESFQMCKNRPPIIDTSQKCKKNTGPILRLLKRRQTSTYLSTKSCDNIYAVNKSSNSLDWHLGKSVNHQDFLTGFRASQSNSLDWRIGRTVTSCSNQLESQGGTRSAEQLSRNIPSTPGYLQATSSAKSKLVSLLRRLSPRLSRPSKNSVQSSPIICPWVQVEYSTKSADDDKRDDSQESDASFQQELEMNELRKKIAEHCVQICISPTSGASAACVEDQPASYPSIRIEGPEIQCMSHNSRAVDNARGNHRNTVVHSEVAGLESKTSREDCAGEVVPGGGNTRTTLRLRPLSLAVQPLHYHQLSSEVTNKHLNMTSQESIGSCSLDVDTSASDRSDTAVGSISDKTLHSLSFSCNGELTPSPDILPNGKEESIQQINFDANKENISNIHHDSSEPEQLTAKKPSYLGLACSISGYSGITRYDSKLREGFRSRDTSPGSRLITRDTSPAGFRSSENLSLPSHQPSKSLSISPLAMERQNGFSNGVREEYKIHTFVETRNTVSTCESFSEVDKGVPLHTTFADISPVHGNPDISPIKKSPGMVRVVAFSQQNKSFMSNVTDSSPKSTSFNVTNTSMTEMSMTNGSSVETENHTFNSSFSSEKSFIQQRVERLYGPGALAQGFFFKRSPSKLNNSDCFLNKSLNNNNDVSTDDVKEEESLKSLPVLRHLRPEFRAQLPVVSPRKPTDGSEQVIKSLQRVTSSVQRNEQKSKAVSSTIDLNKCTARNESIANSKQSMTSVTNIPDHQPAALEVVLPVLEPSASSHNIAKHIQETEKVAEEKDGHYFIEILKAETERLLSLAASAEAELAGGDPSVLPEEAAGKLRSAAGKARLLATQKMQQFEGLCQKNINQIPGEEFPTTNEDLAGFWDMVMLQVIQVNELFDQIRRLKNSQWKEVIPDSKAITSLPQNGSSTKRRVNVTNKAKSTVNSEANRKAREAREQARRQMIEERRRAMRSQAQNKDQSDADSVKIFVPET
ncbi:uncharacterized protein LOC107225761 isoform X1 [Neodiprion lecontei]|uniref:Uncharacterized protein LOC107225761 isoform X1 n=1 Tax=Neodiprion lecontei TaxID=441921 RepID=A0ABM3G0C3_NEOLC|nr:uncharacterized protein LOC107225761 isoform X1 [Neodiprion lecontei]